MHQDRSSPLLIFAVVLTATISITAQRYNVPDPGDDDPPPIAKPNTAPTPEPKPLDRVEQLKNVIAINPADWHAHNELGVLYARKGRGQEAVDLFARASELNPRSAGVLLNLSIAHDGLGNTALALDAIDRSLAIDGNHATANRQRCELLVILKEAEPAVKCYEKLMKLTPSDALVHARYIYALAAAGLFKKAEPVGQRALELFPKKAEIYNAIGLTYYNRKKYDQATLNFRRAVELDANFDAARFNLAVTNFLNDNKAEAVKQYGQIKKTRPGMARRLYELMYRDLIISAVNPKLF